MVDQPQVLKDEILGRRSPDRVMNAEFNDIVYGKKITQAGVRPGAIFGDNSATVQLVGKRKAIRAINTTGSIQYVTFGNKDITTPTVTTGVALLPNSVEYLNSGLDEYVITSNNGVQLVVLQDIL